MPEIQVQNRSLASGFCPSTYQDILNAFTAQQYITVSDSSGQWQFSSEKPTDNTKAWWRLDQFGRPERVYRFAQGAWLSYHPLPSGFVMPWFDALPDFTTFDGGDASTVNATPISGPMWERITTIDGRFPLTTGTLPSGLVVAVGTTGGEEKHTMTLAELVAHTHDIKLPPRNDPNTDTSWEAGSGSDVTVESESTGGGTPFNVMPPYVGMNWLKRTSRVFYRVP